MNRLLNWTLLLCIVLIGSSCVSKKKFASLQSELTLAQEEIAKCDRQLKDYMDRLSTCQANLNQLKSTNTKISIS